MSSGTYGRGAGHMAELRGLIAELCEQTLSAERAIRLEEIVAADADCAAYYIRMIQVHTGLPRCLGIVSLGSPAEMISKNISSRGDLVLREGHGLTEGSTPVIGFLGSVVNTSFRWLSSPRVLALSVTGGIVAYFVILAISVAVNAVRQMDFGPPHSSESSTNSIARITGATDCVWHDSVSSVAVGKELPTGKLRLISGFLEIEFATGATVCLEGPAEFSGTSAKRIELARGRIVAQVPRQAHGFTVRTPAAEVVDLGTEFGVEVNDSGKTEVQVFRGEVEVEAVDPPAQDLNTSKKMRVVAGNGVQVTKGKVLAAVSSTTPSRFVHKLPRSSKEAQSTRPPYTDFVLGQTAPAFYWTFNETAAGKLADLLQRRTPDSVLASLGAIGPRPEGGFNGMATANQAAQLNGDGGVLCSGLNERLGAGTKEYSLQLWFNSQVSFDKQPLHFLLGRGSDWRTVDGLRDLVFVVGSHASEHGRTGYLVVSDGASEAFSHQTQLKANEWYQLTLVRKQDRLGIYLNGLLEVACESPWRGGEGSCFMFGHRTLMTPGLGLNGKLDEVAVWNRAVTDEEVLKMFQTAQRPFEK